ncbi:MAG: 5'/3'-nucleotidase SurE, partial [Duodenibacillus sp.]|nr:5'/3'-nucleotidase SurE [Duodenibacillus sp.]
SERGTVAGAVEGYIFGVDSIAFSQIDGGWVELDAAAEIVARLTARFLAARRPGDPAALLNVNMPNMPLAAVAGVMTTRLGRRHAAGGMRHERVEDNRYVCKLGPAGLPRDEAPGTDFWATSRGYVSVSPLQIDLTAHERVAATALWASGRLDG